MDVIPDRLRVVPDQSGRDSDLGDRGEAFSHEVFVAVIVGLAT